MNISKIQGTKLTKESFPTLVKELKNGTAKSVAMYHIQNGKCVEACGSTLNSQQYIDNAVRHLVKASTVPEDCGHVLVKIV